MDDTESSSTSDMDDTVMLFPITDLLGEDSNDADVSASENEQESMDMPEAPAEPVSKLPLRLRRRSKAEENGLQNWVNQLKVNTNLNNKAQAISIPAKQRFAFSAPTEGSPGSPKVNWLRALRKARSLEDPWDKFHLDALPTERCIRHRYNAMKKKWSEDEVFVKMEGKRFNKGAMRECFRLKKLSNFSHSHDWKHAANYVAKRYMEEVARDVMFEDVRLQMDAKLWGEEYNRHNPPKKVDIMQMYLLEFVERPGKPLYHLEHFIEGDYTKYNSNSGFVEESIKLTPQAFSHFTFERSGHSLIIVDIQGVGNLWTDPQIHTAEGDDYGDGNLGPKGMALFFHSHVCNNICESLTLTKFDLAATEMETYEKFRVLQMKNACTMVKGQEEHVISASPRETHDLTEFLARNRQRTMSNNSGPLFYLEEEGEDDLEQEDIANQNMDHTDEEMYSPMSPSTPGTAGSMEGDSMSSGLRTRVARVRFLSESEGSPSGTMSEEEERNAFREALNRISRPSSVSHEMNRMQNNNKDFIDSTLGQIHHEMARYHEIGRFALVDNEIDWEAAMFHEQQAADLGVMEAIMTMAQICLGLQHDVLVDCTVEQTEQNINRGVEYMLQAAHAGSRSAMIYMAQAYETGTCLGTDRSRDWKQAIHWYQAAIERMQNDESGEFDATMDNPVYTLQAKMAEMYLQGGFGIEKDPSSAGDLYNEAAEGAMGAMKGRLANKYYSFAEEAYGQVEE